MTRPDLDHDANGTLLRDVLEGLSEAPPTLPGKYLWDERGSEIFDAITRSDSYYATSHEIALLAGCVHDVAGMVGPEAAVVEIGSGATNKVGLLLDALERPRRYIGIDISAEFTAAAAARLRGAYPGVEVVYVEADYSRELPALPLDRDRPILSFLPGSTIGNMEPDAATALLARLRRALGGDLLIGQDPCHDAARLQAAYGSPEMARFHMNILSRLQRELGARVNPDQFRHEARVLDAPRRVEAHLVGQAPTEIAVADRTFAFQPGDTIRTDLSWKYAPAAFADLAAAAGWTHLRHWADADGLFCLHLLRSP